jgi:hypothetical protein
MGRMVLQFCPTKKAQIKSAQNKQTQKKTKKKCANLCIDYKGKCFKFIFIQIKNFMDKYIIIALNCFLFVN